MKKKIFLSYSSADSNLVKMIKPKLARLISETSSFPEFIDVQLSVNSGDDIRKSIRSAMELADAVVVITSPEGDKSEWVNYEAGMAHALGKQIIFVGQSNMDQSELVNRYRDMAMMIKLDANL